MGIDELVKALEGYGVGEVSGVLLKGDVEFWLSVFENFLSDLEYSRSDLFDDFLDVMELVDEYNVEDYCINKLDMIPVDEADSYCMENLDMVPIEEVEDYCMDVYGGDDDE